MYTCSVCPIINSFEHLGIIGDVISPIKSFEYVTRPNALTDIDMNLFPPIFRIKPGIVQVFAHIGGQVGLQPHPRRETVVRSKL